MALALLSLDSNVDLGYYLDQPKLLVNLIILLKSLEFILRFIMMRFKVTIFELMPIKIFTRVEKIKEFTSIAKRLITRLMQLIMPILDFPENSEDFILRTK